MKDDIDWNSKVMSAPFPFIEKVKKKSVIEARGQYAGINLWAVQPQHLFPKCSQFVCNLMRLEVYQYNMAAVPIDSPERSTEVLDKISVADFFNVHLTTAVSPELFLNAFPDHQPVGGVPKSSPYLTDIDNDQPWKRNINHFLNTLLLSESNFNLCTLMKDFHFPGFLTGSWYCKVVWSFFRSHMEQLFAPSLNVCYLGGTTWWCIMRADLEKYKQFLIQYVKEEFGMDQDRKWSDQQSRLLLALLYAKKTFIDPRLLVAAGIKVFQLDQKAGDVVMLDGDIVHLGVCSERESINEAINFIPVSWLVHGLPLLKDWIEWLKGFMMDEQVLKEGYGVDWAQVKGVVFNDKVKMLVGKHCPREFTETFLRNVKRSIGQQRPLVVTREEEKREDDSSSRKRKRPHHTAQAEVQSEPPLSAIDYSELSDDELKKAISHIDKIVNFLNQQEVKDWYENSCPDDR
jgi:hypothetical protein